MSWYQRLYSYIPYYEAPFFGSDKNQMMPIIFALVWLYDKFDPLVINKSDKRCRISITSSYLSVHKYAQSIVPDHYAYYFIRYEEA